MVDKEYPDFFPAHGKRIVAAYHQPPPAVEFELKIALSALPPAVAKRLIDTLSGAGPLPQMTISFDKAMVESASMEASRGEGAFLTLRGEAPYDSVVDIRPPGR